MAFFSFSEITGVGTLCNTPTRMNQKESGLRMLQMAFLFDNLGYLWRVDCETDLKFSSLQLRCMTYMCTGSTGRRVHKYM
ncbi:hypothetical protein RchiOBHm_Chr5g0055561 [Rosa chinensis]|uniref:Uncharacterized protein n=1 Tax=Rosa chinensis TaxID=74649 RepID=A0A2P6QGE3_ROSCH|nr:hypothetical protein RchiOBHm_Chr5g0055561 [Rosa chinensis]